MICKNEKVITEGQSFESKSSLTWWNGIYKKFYISHWFKDNKIFNQNSR